MQLQLQKRDVATPILLGAFAVLNAGDLISTWIDLHAGLVEGNPIMHSMLEYSGFGSLIMYKILVVAIVTIASLALGKSRPKMTMITISICNALILTAVALNIIQYPWG